MLNVGGVCEPHSQVAVTFTILKCKNFSVAWYIYSYLKDQCPSEQTVLTYEFLKICFASLSPCIHVFVSPTLEC